MYESVKYVNAELLAGTTPKALIPSPNAGSSQCEPLFRPMPNMNRPAGTNNVNAIASQSRISGSKIPPFRFARYSANRSLSGPVVRVAMLAPMKGGIPIRPIWAAPKLYGGKVITADKVVTGTVVQAVMTPYSKAIKKTAGNENKIMSGW